MYWFTWSAFKILTGTPAGKRLLGGPRCRWEDKIRMDLKEIGINTRNWIDLAQDRDSWHKMFKKARSSTALTDAQVAKVKKDLDSDRCWTIFSYQWNEKGAQRTSVRLHRVGSSGDFQRAFDEWQIRRTKCIDAGGMYFEDY